MGFDEEGNKGKRTLINYITQIGDGVFNLVILCMKEYVKQQFKQILNIETNTQVIPNLFHFT